MYWLRLIMTMLLTFQWPCLFSALSFLSGFVAAPEQAEL
jgi:hypothetical protein